MMKNIKCICCMEHRSNMLMIAIDRDGSGEETVTDDTAAPTTNTI